MTNSRNQAGKGSLLPLGAYGGLLAGVLTMAAGLRTAIAEAAPPMPLSVALLLVGLCNALGSFWAARRSRVGWAFATSINGTSALVFLLATPKLRDVLEIHLAIAALPAFALMLITTFLAVSAPELE